MSIRSAAGDFDKPGIVMISPVNTTTKPAPAETFTSLIGNLHHRLLFRRKVCVYSLACGSSEAKAIMATWIANYKGNEIRITSSWWSGLEKLFVNNKLQDENCKSWSASSGLFGHLVLKDEGRKSIKVRLVSGCRLFIDDEKVEIVKTSSFF